MHSAPSYTNAICLPCKGCENKALYPNARGGVFDENQRPIDDAFLRREYRINPQIKDGSWDQTTGRKVKYHRLIVPDTISPDRNYLAGRYIFAGYLFPHFGHFILESLSNLWFFKNHPNIPIIWLGVHNQSELNDVNRQFIELLRIKNEIIILTEPTTVEELIVPQPGYLIHTRYTDQQVQALRVIENPQPTAGKKVWLSRSKLSEGKIFNEHLLEKILEANGWEIFHPQDHSIRDQINMVGDAEIIAGIEGSALHILIFIPDYKGEVIIFSRRPKVEFDFITIADALKIKQTVYYPPVVKWSSGLMHWAYNRLWPKLDPVLNALNVKRSRDNIATAEDNLPRIAGNIVGYFKKDLMLELWTRKSTLASKRCRNLLVSETLAFDTSETGDHIDHLDISADQLFTAGILNAKPDLYCFRHQDDEPTLIRAFNSSVTYAKTSTLWLIEYGAFEREVERSNRSNTIQSANVRLLNYISEFMPTYSVIRLKGANAAIVFLKPRPMFQSELGSLANLGSSRNFSETPIFTLQEAVDFISGN